jgi:hypothetical protein
VMAWLAVLSLSPAFAMDRPGDPVVLRGEQVPALLGRDPARVVAFRVADGWEQVPVQIDERKDQDLGLAYGLFEFGLEIEVYADPGTFVGPDPDPLLDADDELVFMAADTGLRPTASMSPPSSVVPGSMVEVRVQDPLDGSEASLYLFESDGTLAQDAGRPSVQYEFKLLSGDFPENYFTLWGENPEESVVQTASYQTRFTDTWVRDEVRVFAGGASGVDILDRQKVLFAPDDGGRNEDVITRGETTFLTNTSGPVRAIRSYLGAVSGPFTQREHLFYAGRQDIRTTLRVHGIGGIMDIYDYSPDASGMTYVNDLNPEGVLVDGQQDNVVPGPIQWEMITGAQGTLVHSHSIMTDIEPFTSTSYYLDDATPAVEQFTGDEHAYGSSGIWIDQDIPSTELVDPFRRNLSSLRVVYYEPPDQTVETARLRNIQAKNPVVLVVD